MTERIEFSAKIGEKGMIRLPATARKELTKARNVHVVVSFESSTSPIEEERVNRSMHSRSLARQTPNKIRAKIGNGLPAHVSIMGVRFGVKAEDGFVIIQHAKWSLMGRGSDVGDAKEKLISEAKDISSFYLEIDDSDLTAEAVKLKAFVRKIVG
jgi:hypothetical protein